VVDSQRINALPLNGRNYAQLALLGAGVAAAEPGSRVETTYGFSANGARSLQNNFLLDGIDNNANLGDVLNGAAYVVQPAVDAIAEFKVETNAYSAEFGRGNGAIMNAVIKSGTNQIHGDIWEFLRNEKVRRQQRLRYLRSAALQAEPVRLHSGRAHRQEQIVLFRRLRRPAHSPGAAATVHRPHPQPRLAEISPPFSTSPRPSPASSTAKATRLTREKSFNPTGQKQFAI
jgi:hypothetical protein